MQQGHVRGQTELAWWLPVHRRGGGSVLEEFSFCSAPQKYQLPRLCQALGCELQPALPWHPLLRFMPCFPTHKGSLRQRLLCGLAPQEPVAPAHPPSWHSPRLAVLLGHVLSLPSCQTVQGLTGENWGALQGLWGCPC